MDKLIYRYKIFFRFLKENNIYINNMYITQKISLIKKLIRI